MLRFKQKSFGRAPISVGNMALLRRSIMSMEDYADRVVEMVLGQDWITRHELLRVYMRNQTMRSLLPQRLSPCQSTLGVCSGVSPPEVIPLHEYGSARPEEPRPRKQRRITHYFLDNDRPQ